MIIPQRYSDKSTQTRSMFVLTNPGDGSLTPVESRTERRWAYRKAARALVMRRRGRWGRPWMQAAVFWLAGKLGMLGNDREMYEWVGETKVLQIVPSYVGLKFQKAIVEACHRTNLPPDELELIIGADTVPELREWVGTADFQAQVDLRQRKAGVHYTWNSVDVRLVPALQGWAVIPKHPVALEAQRKVTELDPNRRFRLVE